MAPSTFSGALNNWMINFRSVVRMNFVNYGMSSLFSLFPGTLKLQVLRAVVDHWDPELHVFRFGYQELCPTIEEFSALLECRGRDSVVIPTPLVSAYKLLMNSLGLNRNEATYLVKGDELNILRIIDKFQPDGNLSDRKHQSRRQLAMCICLLARYLLVSSDGRVSPKLVDVAVQIKEGKDFIPMVLAETLLGLDKVHSQSTTFFSGSPLLLQGKRRKIELKMFSPQIVVDKIVEIVIQSVGHHLGYPFHYKQNVKDLEVQMDKLQKLRKPIEEQIEEAKTRGEGIVDNVLDWLNGADMLRQGVETFMDEKIDKENVQCFKFSCPNFISRYRLSKEAEKMMGKGKSLSEEANFDTISRPAPSPPELQLPSSKEYVSFDSRESVFNRIMEALKDSKANVVGVYGTGGVGKTTMVEKVGEQLKKDGLFDEVVMAVVSQVANVAKIQGVLADRLGLKLEAELTEAGRAIKLWNRLNNEKRNIVMLDDIWKDLNLKEIGIPITNGKKGCKVILTSRKQHALKNMQVDRDFLIQVLSEQEAWNLFKKKTNVVDSHDPLHDIAYAVCRECQGLPVAILAVAAALKGKSMYAWNSSLDKLQKSMLNTIEDIDQQLFTSLRLSYDYLESTDAKSCFLLCCLFPEDSQVPIEALAGHCMARRLLSQNPDRWELAKDIVRSVVNTLKTSCLLLDGKNKDFVKMHDIVRDVAISIAKEEKAYMVKHGVKEWPETGTCEKYSSISLRSETIHELPEELVCPELHTLMLECSSSIFLCKPSTKIPDKFFRGTEKLMVLELNGVTVLPLPSSLEKLTELRMLCLNECKLGDIAILKDLKNKLEVLRLRGSDIKALPFELGELTHLRLLDLGDCEELEVIPNGVISKLQRLEELHFPYSFNNWKGTTTNEEISEVSLEELMSLTRLSTLAICIPFLKLLPEDFGFLNLSRFFIIVGSPLSDYDGDYLERETFSSTSVVLNEVNFEDEGLIDFSILERLLGKPKWSIERGGLCPSRSFNNLTELVLLECKLKYLFSPSCARRLLQLQRLEIRCCWTMEAVIGNEEEKDEEKVTNVISFSQLTTLKLYGLPRFISFYPRIKKATATESHSFPPTQSLFNEKVAFPALEELDIDSFPNTTEIWDKNLLPTDQSFRLLRSLEVGGCEELMNVVPSHMLPRLRNMETLEVHDCSKMEVIVVLEKREEAASNKDIILFPELRSLWLKRLENLKAVCAYKSEDQLNLNVQVVFPKLRIMHLIRLGRLSSFNNTSNITETRPLFNHQVAFPALEELDISSLPNITAIWDKKNLLPTDQSFYVLRSLKVLNCEKLMNVVPSHVLPRLRNVEALGDFLCLKMEVMVVLEKREEAASNKDIIPFPELRTLKLERLENLKAVCAYKSEDQLNFNVQVVFPNLRIMHLVSLGRLSSFNYTSNITETRPLFNHQVAFPALEELSVVSVPNITEIWDKKNLLPTDQSFCLLRSLEVGYCEELMNAVPSHVLPRLQNVEALEVFLCLKMEVIVVLEKREEAASNKDIILFPEVRRLKLERLEILKAVCAYKSEDQLNFNVQVVFPKLRQQDIRVDWPSLKNFNQECAIMDESGNRIQLRRP